MSCQRNVDSEHTTEPHLRYCNNIFSLERLQKTPTHRGSVECVQGGDRGVGAAGLAQLGDAPHGVLDQPVRHLADGCLPKVAPPVERDSYQGKCFIPLSVGFRL